MMETNLLPLSPLFVVESYSIKSGLDECLINVLADKDNCCLVSSQWLVLGDSRS
jgi:hypothetical protein